MFVGVRRDVWPDLPRSARRLAAELALRGEISYQVEDGADEPRTERRSNRRRPTRLRSAKLLDELLGFLTECRICDASINGLRVALARDVGLPMAVFFYLDETGEVRGASVAWRRGRLVGVRLGETKPPGALKPGAWRALGERYYAVPG